VVIDPGMEEKTGEPTVALWYEKDINLDISLKLGNFLRIWESK